VPCVGLEGLPPYPVFALDFSSFDVPSGYVGVDNKAVGHVFIEARHRRESPASPCIGGRRFGSVVAGRWTVVFYRCSADALFVQRRARHGEAVYLGHILFEWTDNGIDYIASAHGDTQVNRNLLLQHIDAMTLVPPTHA
jgi:hypothetical protein